MGFQTWKNRAVEIFAELPGSCGVSGANSNNLMKRLMIYDEVIKLKYRFRFGYKRIARILSMPPSTIHNWLRGNHPLGRCNEVVIGPELSYVIGAWLGDGTLARDRSKSEYYIKLYVKDLDFATEWGRCLAVALNRPTPYIPRRDGRGMLMVRGSSKILYELLKWAKKNPRFLMPILEKYPRDAIRGFFDAEGSVDVKYRRILASNTSNDIIDCVKELLERIGINSISYNYRRSETLICPKSRKVYHRKNRIIHLVIRGRDNILKFAGEIGFSIKRKQLKLMELVERYR